MVYVDESRCVGCGLCVGPCPTGAIRMVGNVAQVEQSLCRECEVCMQACPNGALLSLMEPVGAGASAPVPPSPPVRPPVESPRPASGVGAWMGTAFDFIGREVSPRVRALLEDQQRGRPAEALSRAAFGRASGGRGRGRRGRRRGRW